MRQELARTWIARVAGTWIARIAATSAVVVAASLAIFPATPVRADGAPRLRVLGTVQDGGLPHFACDCPHCEAARTDPSRKRQVACVGLILPRPRGGSSVFVIDATPDVREQVDALRDVRDSPADRVDRAPVDGFLLTHAHIGHYTGLMFLGFEAAHTRRVPVWASPSMCDFLRENGPWSQLVAYENITLRPVTANEPVSLGAGVTAEPIEVPHRREYTDTLGWVLRGPAGGDAGHRTTVLYVPDTDGWDTWSPSLLDVLDEAEVDVALLDGTFFSTEELPGRPVESIGHPLIHDTMDRLEPRVRGGELQVYFIHLNHTNLALDPSGPALAEIEGRGFHVAAEGQELSLLPR
jgi:pyrroloquinoline quinone biosynthesis protein B